jgi:cobalt-precorrin 5A hydrolase
MWGIVTLTRQGLQLARQLKTMFPASEIYTLPKWEGHDVLPISGNLQHFTGVLFDKHKVLIFIMASGIVVRCIAKHLKDKTTDPAVLVMDEKGRYVISLLSGHLGGANEVANKIASRTGAEPVITTSSDVNGLIAVDILSKQHGLLIGSMTDAKIIMSMMLNGQQIGQINDSLANVPVYFHSPIAEAEGVVIISGKAVIRQSVPFVKLVPVNIIMGIGCRKETSADDILDFITFLLLENNIDTQCLKCMATIDQKKDEPGILEVAAHMGLPLLNFSDEQIGEVEHLFQSSAFVKEKIGVGCVCEPAAYLAGGRRGRFIAVKTKRNGITLSLFEEEIDNSKLHFKTSVTSFLSNNADEVII